MLNAIARKVIQSMESRYDYDASYLHYLREKSPQGFWKFVRAGALSRHREKVPVEAFFTVQLMATMLDDCGSCTQLIANFAKEAKVPTDQIEAVLIRDEAAMSTEVALAYLYAEAVLNNRSNAADVMAEILDQWGDKGLIDLAMAMQGVRLYPLMKKALGFAQECERVSVNGRWIAVAKRAA